MIEIRILCCALAILLAGARSSQSEPRVDYHQHLFSPTTAKRSPGVDQFTAGDLIGLLDSAGIRRAVVLSLAYQSGNPNRPAVEDEYAQVRAENDWTAVEVAGFSDRLSGFCSVQNAMQSDSPEASVAQRRPYGATMRIGAIAKKRQAYDAGLLRCIRRRRSGQVEGKSEPDRQANSATRR